MARSVWSEEMKGKVARRAQRKRCELIPTDILNGSTQRIDSTYSKRRRERAWTAALRMWGVFAARPAVTICTKVLREPIEDDMVRRSWYDASRAFEFESLVHRMT